MENNEQSQVLTRAEKRARRKEARQQARQHDKNSKVAQVAGAVIILFAAIVGWQAFNKNDASSLRIVTPEPSTIGENENVKGNENSDVVLVEYSDFQCPACANYYPIVKQLMSEYSEKIALVYRHFPLYSIHPNAEEAAWAAEAASKQGKFWEMHDMLFEKQSQWSSERNVKQIFGDYAESLGLNREQWEADYESNEVRDKVSADVVSGNKANVNSTPSFFINGTKMTQPKNLDDFRRIIEMELSIAENKAAENTVSTTESNDGNVSVTIDGQGEGLKVESVTTTNE